LGAPQDNDTYNFVSLGFGGSITLELEQPLYNTNGYGPDFILVETSFGRADEKCFKGGNAFSYPETAVIEVSDGKTWRSLPDSYCRTSFIDISPVIDNTFQSVKLIRIKDFSNKEYFEKNADGFDVDGLIVCPNAVKQGFTAYTNGRVGGGPGPQWDATFFNHAPNDAADEVRESISINPNPTNGNVANLHYYAEKQRSVVINLYSTDGKIVLSKSVNANVWSNVYEMDISTLNQGLYIVRLVSEHGALVAKFIKN